MSIPCRRRMWMDSDTDWELWILTVNVACAMSRRGRQIKHAFALASTAMCDILPAHLQTKNEAKKLAKDLQSMYEAIVADVQNELEAHPGVCPVYCVDSIVVVVMGARLVVVVIVVIGGGVRRCTSWFLSATAVGGVVLSCMECNGRCRKRRQSCGTTSSSASTCCSIEWSTESEEPSRRR